MTKYGLRSRFKKGIKRALGMSEPAAPSSPVSGPVDSPAPASVVAAATQPATPVAEPVTLVAEPAPVAAEPAQPVAEPVAPVAAEPVAPVAAEPVAPVAAEPDPVAAPSSAAAPDASTEPDDLSDTAGAPFTYEQVQEILDDMVRPALQGDGGDIALLKVEDNDIYVKLVGACSTCPSSIMTMKMGIEALLKEEFPAMRELIQVEAPGAPPAG